MASSSGHEARNYIDVTLVHADLAPEDVQVHLCDGKETISQLFSFDVQIVYLNPAGLPVEALAGTIVSLVFTRAGEELRQIHGIIAAIDENLHDQTEHRTYSLRVVPRAYQLTLVETQEVFLDLSVPQIIEQKLVEVGLGGQDYELRLSGTYPVRDLVIQYRETDLAFISRLAEHLGISFYFDFSGGADRIVFTDQMEGFAEGPPALLRTRGDQTDVYRLDLRTQIIPSAYAVQDYNYRTPQVDIQGLCEAPGAFAGGVVEYGSHHKTPEEGAALAAIRAEERQASRRVYTGMSDLCRFGAGTRVAIEGPHAASVLITEVVHRARRPVLTHGGQAPDRDYENTFRAVPAGQTYRPPRVTPRPRIHGLVNAVIEHPIDQGVERWSVLDDWGRYTVRFLFDTAAHGPKHSRQIRMVQPHVGTNYGMRFPLKPGMEVMIGFVDGDPDRPVIVGGVYRPDTPSPVTVQNATINKLKSESGVLIEFRDA